MSRYKYSYHLPMQFPSALQRFNIFQINGFATFTLIRWKRRSSYQVGLWENGREERLSNPPQAFYRFHHSLISHSFFTYICSTTSISVSRAPYETLYIYPTCTHRYVRTHSRDQYSLTPSHCKDKTSRSLTYNVTEYQSYSGEPLFASPRMFLSLNIKGL